MTEYANTDDFVAPVPAVQYFLLLLAAKKPERLREIFAYEKNIADKLLTVPESEAVGENKRYLCLFQQVETKEWWRLVWTLLTDRVNDNQALLRQWMADMEKELVNFSSAEPRITWKMLQWSQEYNRVTGVLDAASHRLPEPHKFWTLMNPLGWTSPLEASDWIQMAALLRPDAVQWSKQTLEASYRHATLGNYAYKPAIPFQKTADEVFKQAAFHGRCDGDAFLNTKSWNLSQGDQHTSLTSSDRLAIFLSLLTANPQVILQIAAFLQIREWMQAAAIEVAKKPANPDLEFIPHGQTKMNISKAMELSHLHRPHNARQQGLEAYHLIGNCTLHYIHHLAGRKWLVKEETECERKFVHLRYISAGFERISIRTLMRECLEMIGLDAELLDPIVFGWRYEPQIKHDFYKPKEVFCNWDTHAPLVCECKRWPWVTYLDKTGHVRTLDPKILGSRILTTAIEKGLNHITPKPLQTAKIIAEVCEAWDRIASMIPDVYIRNWPSNEAAVKQHINYRVRMAVQNCQTTPMVDVMTTPEAKRQLEWVHKHLYISGADKAANTPTFFCKTLAREQALARMNSDDFSLVVSDNNVPETPEQVVKQLLSEPPLQEFPPQKPDLPYLMGIYKAHKNKMRWLTNADGCIFSEITICLTAILKGIQEALQYVADDFYARAKFFGGKTNACWILGSTQEFTINLPDKITTIYTGDITKCYEAIPLEGDQGLTTAMTNLVNLAFAHQNHLHKDLFLIQKKNSELEAEWKPLRQSSVKATRMDPTKVIELNHFIIRNTYVRLGDRVWRQVRGIPMGFSCSPLWCNLYLFYFEYNFITRLARLGRYDLLRLFEHTFRYMDDLVSMNNPMILRFTDGSLVNLSAHFLSLQIQIIRVDGTFLTTKYDKRRSLPFKVSLYIHRDSNRPITNSSKVILGQVFALFYLINTAGGVVLEIDNLVECFVEKGFHRYALRRLILSGLDRIILTSPLTPVQAVLEILFDIWREPANRPPQLDDSANSS
ncbi:hypothetical protein SELMODRAFT_425932 [Selaginella moellendorffii]|uniref:Reverse transcriptase domain-containing protein n=1 Tax=Selaginella moellendorffii TaxID=88036 RepID=D8SUS8_SELML|nr:hypothetical protein SELMODRAFT_425932 [Selaginella moellendorffii]